MRVYNENRTDFEASGFCPNTTLLSQIQHINVHIIIKSQMNKQSKIRRRAGGTNKHSNSSEKQNETANIPSGSIQMSKLVTCKNTKCHY